MSRVFTGSLSNHLTTAGGTHFNLENRTAVVWIKLASLPSANSTAVFAGRTSSGENYLGFGLDSSNTPRAQWRNSSSDFSNSTETVPTGTWFPIVARFSNTAGDFTVTGPTWANRDDDTTAKTHTETGSDVISIGRNGDNTPSDPFTGLIAHVAIWDAELSDSDMQALAEGADPTTIAVADRYMYWPLTDSGLTDTWSGSSYELTVNGTVATDADNPAFGGGGGEPDVYVVGGGVVISLPLPVAASTGSSTFVVTGTGSIVLPIPTMSGVGSNGDTIIIGDDPIWPPRYNDARIMYLIAASGITPTGAIQDDIKLALATLLGVASDIHKYTIDDLWMRYKVANGI